MRIIRQILLHLGARLPSAAPIYGGGVSIADGGGHLVGNDIRNGPFGHLAALGATFPINGAGEVLTRAIKLGVVCLFLASPALADDGMMNEHGGSSFHAIRLETGISHKDGTDGQDWDLDGWVGGDVHRLWLKSEGEIDGGKTQSAEIWGLYSRRIATFWDVQVGLRQDVKPLDHTYLTAGFNGLAPYFFDTEAHVFVREDGALSARLRQENELLLTNRLILRPRFDLNFNVRKDTTESLGSGLTDAGAELQLRYEVTRGFAPYLSLSHAQSLGETADLKKARGQKARKSSLSAGIRFLF